MLRRTRLQDSDLLKVLPQTLLSGCAVVLAIWSKLPWTAILGLGLLNVEIASISSRRGVSQWEAVIPWGCTALVGSGLLFAKGGFFVSAGIHAVIGLLNAVAIMLASGRRADVSLNWWWKILALTWASSVSVMWLGYTYVQNLRGPFYLGLLITLVVLVICKNGFRLPAYGVQTLNTFLLLLVGLPVADLFVRPRLRAEPNLDPNIKYYSYDWAKKDPGGYASWQSSYEYQLGRLWRHVFIVGSLHSDPPWYLHPNTHGSVFGSRISINSNGFRGTDIPKIKGNSYRIVALGESTTFGITIRSEDKPWPELLEQMIRERLSLPRPVEVINAGVPSYDLKMNLDRLPGQILPLQPDMIISYHGYNGFPLLGEAMPPFGFKNPPAYSPRPLKLLADCEFRLKIIGFKRQAAKLNLHPPSGSNPLETEYARAYSRLIQIARTNGIRLVLANYSMAVNSGSDRDVIEFHRRLYPTVYWDIKANQIHSAIVGQLADQHPEICFVNTHPHLDGEHYKFIDLMHFDYDGERQIAETFFEGIKAVLEEELKAHENRVPVQ